MAKVRKLKLASKRPSVDDLDDLARIYVMLRDKGKCRVCGSTRYLQTAHFITRSNKHTRWDEDNLFLLCSGCHTMRMNSWHKDPATATEWVRKTLGEKEFDKLRMRANDTSKIDRNAIKVYLKAKINELSSPSEFLGNEVMREVNDGY